MTAVLTALHDIAPEPGIDSHLYLAFDCDMPRYQTVMSILERAGLVKRQGHRSGLTVEGIKKAVELKAVLASHGVA